MQYRCRSDIDVDGLLLLSFLIARIVALFRGGRGRRRGKSRKRPTNLFFLTLT
jgi:hypothetical protein